MNGVEFEKAKKWQAEKRDRGVSIEMSSGKAIYIYCSEWVGGVLFGSRGVKNFDDISGELRRLEKEQKRSVYEQLRAEIEAEEKLEPGESDARD